MAWTGTVGQATPEVQLGALVVTYAALLYRVAYAVLRNRGDAEDAVQDAFVRVLQRKESLEDVRDVRAWLVRIIWNLALDRKRKARPEALDEEFAHTLAASYAAADRVLAETQQVQQVLQHIDKLPKLERQVLLLSALEELEIAEVANVVGRSEAAVRGLLFRARNRLRERLERTTGR